MYDAREDLHALQIRHNIELAQLRRDLEHAQQTATQSEDELARLKPLVRWLQAGRVDAWGVELA
jgi:hypothetical protein